MTTPMNVNTAVNVPAARAHRLDLGLVVGMVAEVTSVIARLVLPLELDPIELGVRAPGGQ